MEELNIGKHDIYNKIKCLEQQVETLEKFMDKQLTKKKRRK
jgi:hypothetical protein